MEKFESLAVTAWRNQYTDLMALTVQLRDSARNEQWQVVEDLMAKQLTLTATLGEQVPADVLDALGHEEIVAVISEIVAVNTEAINRIEAWRQNLLQSLDQIQNVQMNMRRLGKSYG